MTKLCNSISHLIYKYLFYMVLIGLGFEAERLLVLFLIQKNSTLSFYCEEKLECAALACVAYDEEKGSVTLSFADVSALRGMSAKVMVQEVWGPDAGGHDGIAGSPRGVAVTKEEFLLLLRNVEEDLAVLG